MSTASKSANAAVGGKQHAAAAAMESFAQGTPSQSPSQSQAVDYPKFDAALGGRWVFPTNFAERKYQYAIARTALVANTLVQMTST